MPKTYVRPQHPTDAVGAMQQPTIAQFFGSRGIPEQVVEEMSITASGPPNDPVIHFPYYRNGQLVNIKHRGKGKKFWMEPGAELILYRVDEMNGEDCVAIVEGEMDALTFAAVGAMVAVSVPNGGGTSRDFGYLTGVAEVYLREVERVYIATDMDETGCKLADELARRIGYEKCWRIRWPEGCKDANETLMRDGEDGISLAINRARPYPVRGIHEDDDFDVGLEEHYDGELHRGLVAGWSHFDTLYRARPGTLVVVTGVPSHGKSGFLDNLMIRLAEQHGWPFAIFSPENQPLVRHRAELISIRLGKPFYDGPTPRMTREEMHAERDWGKPYFSFVMPEEPTIANILQLADIQVYRRGIKGLIIDPWNELDHSRPPGMTETEFVSGSLSKLRNWARLRDVVVWLVAHPTKPRKDDDGISLVPTPYDISGSAHFANKADVCLSVWRNPSRPDLPMEVHTQKVRYRETGQIGIGKFKYDPTCGRIEEAR